MFTFVKHKDPIFYIGDKPVYTQFKKEDSKRIRPYRETKKYLDSEDFREAYSLSRKEGAVIKQAIQSDIVPDTPLLKRRFYEIRKDLNTRLYSEIDLRDTKHAINWRLPIDKKQWPGTSIVIGSSGVGKTHLVKSWIEESLKRKRKKRKFIYVSPELAVDETLQKLRASIRYQDYFTGIDVSEENQQASDKNIEDWWREDIEAELLKADPGTTIVLDDAPDSPVYKQLRTFLTRYLRTGRHKKVGIISIQHNVRGGKWTSQSFSSVKNVILFPRGGGKGKQVEFLNETVGLSRRKARELIDIISEDSRWLAIHMWSPTVIYSEKYAVFV